jgi:hypothetical protein
MEPIIIENRGTTVLSFTELQLIVQPQTVTYLQVSDVHQNYMYLFSKIKKASSTIFLDISSIVYHEVWLCTLNTGR